MKRGLKSCLFVVIALIGLCVIGMVAMAIFNLCPPAGPWPMPPWCGINSQETVDLPPVASPTVSLPATVPSPEGITIENAIVIPTDVRAIDYPNIFNNPTITSAQVIDPYCAIEQEEVAFPADYLGSYEFPQVTGAPLPAEINRIVGIKDVWIPEPNHNSCPYSVPYEKMRQALDTTLLRVEALGGDGITFTNYIHFVDFENAELQQPDKSAITASDLRYIADRAQQMGLEMTLYLNLAPGQVEVSWEIPSGEWLATLINNWEPFVLEQAQLAEETGIDALMLNHFDYQPSITGFEDVYQTEMLEVVNNVREIYSGRILLMIDSIWGADLGNLETLLSAVDGFIYTPNTTPLAYASDKTVSVSNLRSLFLNNLNSISSDFAKFNQPFLLRVLIQSEKGFLESGWNEDMFCIAKEGNTCYQKDLEVDFSLQAIAYEAMLEVIAQAHADTSMVIDGIDTYGYWFTDVILPSDSQPQLAQSIRNKPAESVVFEWFKR